MQGFCTITPTRGDRPQLLEFCKHQLSRTTVKPDKSYFIDYKPTSQKVDLWERLKKGIELAKADGFNEVFIVEDDDYYKPNYFEYMKLGDADFIGSYETQYYHVLNSRYHKFNHEGRSSLFHTGFKISALTGWNYYAPLSGGIDISLWKFAADNKIRRTFIEPVALGIKHGIGLCVGVGHKKLTLRYSDPEQTRLKQFVDPEAYIFYQTLRKP